MKKSILFLFQLLGLALKTIAFFSLIIIGIDLYNRYKEDKEMNEDE